MREWRGTTVMFTMLAVAFAVDAVLTPLLMDVEPDETRFLFIVCVLGFAELFDRTRGAP